MKLPPWFRQIINHVTQFRLIHFFPHSTFPYLLLSPDISPNGHILNYNISDELIIWGEFAAISGNFTVVQAT